MPPIKLMYKLQRRVENSMHKKRNCRLPATPYAIAVVAACIVLGACTGGSVALPTAGFPVPLVEKVQLPVGIHLDDALSSYTHVETVEGHGDWEIELGSAQQSMFENLLEGMFIGHRFVERTDAHDPSIAAVLVPSIEELQFTLPSQTRTEYHEVWIRYRFKMLDNRGNVLGDWPLMAYGKSHQQNHGGASASLRAAALDACRDAMADFAIRFRSFPGVADWLQNEQGPST